MEYDFKEIMNRPERFAPGHRMCAGCGATICARNVLRALDPNDKAVIGCATGCLNVSSFQYPYVAWEDSYIHSAFENASSTMSGVCGAYLAMKRKGKINENYKFIVFGGDGGTYDIGIQSLSGAMERGTDYTYVCYDNGAYMNTGTQRSSATPMYADTTTTPVGANSNGKEQYRKDLTAILVAHNIPYAAQTTFFNGFRDLHTKSRKAIYKKGPSFLNVLSPCPTGWKYETDDIMEICRLAVETNYWPLYEVEDGKWTLNYEPKHRLPIEDFLKTQGRFAHLFRSENEHLIEEYQREVDRRWETLQYMCSRENN